MLPIVGVLGAGYDFMNVTTQSMKLQTTLESAALAAATLTNLNDVEEVVADYVDSNVSLDEELRNSVAFVTEDISEPGSVNKRTIKVTASASFGTVFLKIFDIPDLPIEVESTASQAAGNLEIAVVLDISASMRGSKFTNMQSAAKDFVSTIIDGSAEDTVSISMVPFAATVNIGADMYNRLVVDETRAKMDPPKGVYRGYIGGRNNVATAGFRFSTPTRCIETDYKDYDLDLIPDASRSQFPHFVHNVYTFCPANGSSVIFNSDDKSELHDRIDDFAVSWGTGMEVGAMWGLKALSPSFRGILGGDYPNRPADFDERETTKVLVVMTDGVISAQLRPRDLTGRDQGRVHVVRKGSLSSSSATDDAVGRFRKTCEVAKRQGIVVYTIGFQITAGSIPDSLLKECASDLDKYYFIDTLDVAEAFTAITTSLSKLRIIG